MAHTRRWPRRPALIEMAMRPHAGLPRQGLPVRAGRILHPETALRKVLCHNICCLIQSMFELNLKPKFSAEVA
jgi:hypothetical protein